MNEFCNIHSNADGSKTCTWCGSWTKRDVPSCPPYITSKEPDNRRLPHITTSAENKQAKDAHLATLWADQTPVVISCRQKRRRR